MMRKEKIPKELITQAIIDLDFKEDTIDRDFISKNASKIEGSVRIAEGLYDTRREFEDKRKRVLAKGLP